MHQIIKRMGKLWKCVLKSNKGSGNFLPLQNIINDKDLEEFAYDDEEKCDLLNKYFSFISKSRNRIDKNNNIADLNVSVKEISDVIQILHANKASEPKGSAISLLTLRHISPYNMDNIILLLLLLWMSLVIKKSEICLKCIDSIKIGK